MIGIIPPTKGGNPDTEKKVSIKNWKTRKKVLMSKKSVNVEKKCYKK
jgi:hypothetical protein